MSKRWLMSGLGAEDVTEVHTQVEDLHDVFFQILRHTVCNMIIGRITALKPGEKREVVLSKVNNLVDEIGSDAESSLGMFLCQRRTRDSKMRELGTLISETQESA